MSFAFEIEAMPNRGLRVLHAGSVALAATGFGLAGWLAPPAWGLGLGAIGVPACWLAWRLGDRGLSFGRLAVDAHGDANWQPAASGGAQRVRIERWCTTERLAWVALRANGERRRRDVLFVRGACDARRWRSLRAWLIWLGRGPA
ncbi:MAG TPA: hypothetical protein VK052_07785 [Zeimonas sp.]|nr:hypothetical protein [Zeimonas sp.]